MADKTLTIQVNVNDDGKIDKINAKVHELEKPVEIPFEVDDGKV